MIRFIVLLCIVILICITTAGCEVREPNGPNTIEYDSIKTGMRVNALRRGASFSDLGIWVDPRYGCQYFTGETKGGIFMTIRYGADRMPICDNGASLEDTEQRRQYNRLKQKFEAKTQNGN